MSAGQHVPVMLREVIAALAPRDGAYYIDGTFGGGGYATAILEAADCRVLGIDRDPDAIARGQALVQRFAGRLTLSLGEFSHMDALSGPSDGIVLDLGVSSFQFDTPARGFSFRTDGPLDMRMSKGEGPSAADVVNGAPEAELVRIFREFGEERHAPRIARAIVADRAVKPFERTGELAEMIARVARSRERSKHPATRVFQALRIYVNGELDELENALDQSLARLAPCGRLAVISFHSLEDRMVKQFMRRHASPDPVYAGLPFVPAHAAPKLKLVGKRVTAGESEIERNPRARSARLRVAERNPVDLAA